jgi:hypothetical protein
MVNTRKTKKPNRVNNRPGIAMKFTRRNKREPINNNRRNKRPPYIKTRPTRYISIGEPALYFRSNPTPELAPLWEESTMPASIRAKLAPRQLPVRNDPFKNLPLEYFMK